MAHLDRDTFQRLARARELLLAAREEPLTVRDVARRVTLSPFHFIRRFEEVFGATPSRYRTTARIERARELLALGELSVTEVCHAVGFESLGSFSALFKQRVGLSPSAYGRRLRVLVPVPGRRLAELRPGCLSLMALLPPDAFVAFRNREEAPPPPPGHAPGLVP